MLRKIIVSVGLCCALVGLGVFIFQQMMKLHFEAERRAYSTRGFAVRTMKAERRDLKESLLGYGTARAFREADISSQTGGRLIRVKEGLREGTSIREGELLFQIDTSDYENEVSRIEGMFEQAQADLLRITLEERNLEEKIEIARSESALSGLGDGRMRQLVESGIAAQTEMDNQLLRTTSYDRALLDLERQLAVMEPQRRSAEGQVKTRRSELARAQLALDRTQIRAPFDGYVEEMSVEVGELISPNDLLARLVDLSRIEIPIELPASKAPLIKEGVEARIYMESEDQPLAVARVDRVSPKIDPVNRTFRVYLVVDNPDSTEGLLRPGIFVKAEIDGPVFHQALAIPRSLFVEDLIYVVEDGIARQRRPTVLGTVGANALIGGGLEEGEEIIASNLEIIFDGAAVDTESALPSAGRTALGG